MLFSCAFLFQEALCAESPAIEINIPQQSLGDALQNLALQADFQVFFEDELLAGRQSPGIAGLFTPAQALERLLAGTQLQYVVDERGAIVIQRASAPLTVARIPATVPAPVAVPQPARPPAFVYRDWALRVRGQSFQPGQRSVAFGTIPENGVRTDSRWIIEAGIEYFLGPAWSTEFSIGQRRGSGIRVLAAASESAVRAGELHLLPLSWTVKYNLLPEMGWRPYLGAGVSHTSYTGNLGVAGRIGSSYSGPMVLIGFDARLSDRWFLSSDVRWQRQRPTLQNPAGDTTRLRLDPVRFGIGVTYRLGDYVAAQE